MGYLRRRRARRQAKRAEADAFLAATVDYWRTPGRGTTMWTVLRVYQHAQRGTKAVIAPLEGGPARDAWFWWSSPRAGTTVAASPVSGGWGPHNQNACTYIGDRDTRQTGVHATFNRRYVDAWRRHWARAGHPT